ncbi:MAG TPA: hypothetical protein DHM37_05820 [Candidatus Cloacimonas sp.]|jgi:predicted transcriptional regulator|nr:hypothetical protein [Candidatus Cloacimonas sp.]
MLSEIIEYFHQKKVLSISEIATWLNSNEEAVEGMLQILLRKKMIKPWRPACKSCSSSCASCNLVKTKYYQWISA